MSEYFDSTTNRIVAGALARSSDVNDFRDEVGVGFDKLPSSTSLKNGAITYATETGSGNLYEVEMENTQTSYIDGLEVIFNPTHTNTGASTLNVDSLGVKAIKRPDGTDVTAGDLLVGQIVSLRYNGTYFVFTGSIPNSFYAEADTARDESIAAKDIAVAKEALMNPHYTAIDAVYANEVNVNKVAAIDLNVTKVADIDTDVTKVADNEININKVANNDANVTKVANIDTDVSAVALIDTDVTAVKNNATDVSTVAANLTGTNTIGAVAAIDTQVSTVAGDTTAINNIITNLDAVQNASANALAAETSAGEASDSADAASDSAADSAADRVQTGLDASATAADAIATGEDRVQTGLDVAATNADVVTTGNDVNTTNANVIITQADVLLTHADVVSTNADVVSSTANAASALTSKNEAASSAASAADEVSAHTTNHPAPTVRDARNQIAGDYATGIGTASGTNTGDQTAATVPNTPAGNIVATDVQAAINELDGEKALLAGSATQAFSTSTLNASGNITIIGANALRGSYGGGGITTNFAAGDGPLQSNTTGNYNTASGYNALSYNTTGSHNTANGYNTLYANTTGSYNTASGYNALRSNTTGLYNTASGGNALYYNTTGTRNTAIGYFALSSNTTGSGNTALSPINSAGTYAPVFNPTVENNRFCMGSTGVTNAYINVAWTIVSDARDKTDFATVPHGLDFVSNLKPTAFRYKIDREGTEGHGPVRYGFLAQDVLALEGDTPVIVDAEDSEKLRFNDESLLAVTIKAIQELNAKFDAYVATHP